jgi:hypothetical protein
MEMNLNTTISKANKLSLKTNPLNMKKLRPCSHQIKVSTIKEFIKKINILQIKDTTMVSLSKIP